jgi:hypothetical protein
MTARFSWNQHICAVIDRAYKKNRATTPFSRRFSRRFHVYFTHTFTEHSRILFSRK